MPTPTRRNPLFWGFLAVSLALHLLLLFLLPQHLFPPALPPSQPMVVEVRPPAPLPLPRDRELDYAPAPPPPAPPPPKPAKRLADQEHRVAREKAPKGEMPEDRPAPSPKVARPRPERAAPAPAQSRNGRPSEESIRPGEGPPTTSPPSPPSPPSTTKGSPSRVPGLDQLLRLPESTVARMEGEWRRKYRSDVEKGDAVWLDTEKDLLISFFQRFKNNIYGVWNYPAGARERGEQGTCLLRITLQRDGSLKEVKLLESSGSSSLDNEAVAAVRRASPYGPLPRAYEEESLTIFAFFSYQLTQRRGRIY